MMTTPQDLEDFVVGFILSEGVISSSADIHSLDVVRLDDALYVSATAVSSGIERLPELEPVTRQI